MSAADQNANPQEGSPVPERSGVSHLEGIGEGVEFRCGYVALIGNPNVGKSTLLNTFLNRKISIVTPKPQTTRRKVVGLLSTDNYQVVFLDTPGIIKPKYLLQQAMMGAADSAAADADLVLFMMDATRMKGDLTVDLGGLLKRFQALHSPAYLIINKVDIIRKPDLLPMIAAASRMHPFKEIFPVSALKHEGTEQLLASIVKVLPVHPPFYPLDIVSEQSERFFIGEIIREKIFLYCQEEVPYSTEAAVTGFQEQEGGKTVITADIYVTRDSQRGILIGKQGAMLKQIGSAARRDIEAFLDRPVYLDLRVRTLEGWRDKKQSLENLGYKA